MGNQLDVTFFGLGGFRYWLVEGLVEGLVEALVEGLVESDIVGR